MAGVESAPRPRRRSRRGREDVSPRRPASPFPIAVVVSAISATGAFAPPSYPTASGSRAQSRRRSRAHLRGRHAARRRYGANVSTSLAVVSNSRNNRALLFKCFAARCGARRVPYTAVHLAMLVVREPHRAEPTTNGSRHDPEPIVSDPRRAATEMGELTPALASPDVVASPSEGKRGVSRPGGERARVRRERRLTVRSVVGGGEAT